MLLFLTLALFSLHLTSGKHATPQENFRPDSEGRRFTYEDGNYEISVMRLDWYTARNLCKTQGGQLLSIESEEENTAVLQALSGHTTESFWTSGSNFDMDEFYYWDSTGASLDSFTFWGPEEPFVNNTDHCVQLNSSMSHFWADAECDLEIFFVCEFHPCSLELELENTVAKEIKNPLLRFTFENGTYEISDEKLSWVDAKGACKSRGMELVSIETNEENVAILDAIALLDAHFWTSGTNLGHLDNYYWEGTGHAVGPFSGWYPGQPNDPTHFMCLNLNYGFDHMWADDNCPVAHYYICELQPC